MTTQATISLFKHRDTPSQQLPKSTTAQPITVGLSPWQSALVAVMVWLGCADAMAQAAVAQAGYRATPETKLQAATDFIQKLVDEDRAPMKGFYGNRTAGAAGGCGGYGAVRGIQLQSPRFESKRQNIVVVPVIAELLYIQATNDGGKSAAANGTQESLCAFEYERWSFTTRKFERIPGFRSREHRDEFVNWGEHRFEDKISRFVLVDLDKRYVRFHARVNVNTDWIHQLGPVFPKHYDAINVTKVLDRFTQNRVDLIALGRSDNNQIVFPADVAKDLPRMQWQLERGKWISNGIKQRLESFQSTPSFQEISK